jgi:hypothetical protein
MLAPFCNSIATTVSCHFLVAYHNGVPPYSESLEFILAPGPPLVALLQPPRAPFAQPKIRVFDRYNPWSLYQC